MPLSSYIAPLLGGAVLMTACYALGRFGYSIGWIWIFIVLNFVKSKLWKQREKRLLSLRQTAMMEKEVVLAHLQDLPAWVQFPDTERVEWINKVILQLWPYIGEYTKQFIKEFIEPQVKASMPGPFKSFRFESMDMGDIPLRVGGIKVYTENVGRDRIILDMDVMYAGDCDFVVSVGMFKGGLNQMQFSGKLRCILKPLLAYPPMVGGVSAFLLDDPILDFNLTGLGELVELPGLLDVVRNVVIAQIRAIAVLPNEIVVPLTAETDVTRLHFPEPDGVIRIHAYEAKDLENRDISFIKKGKSDPYCHISVGAQLFKTKVVDNNLNPKWDEFFEAVVDQASGQKLLVEVFDEDPGCNDEELGRLRVDLSTVQEKGVIDTWYPLEGAKHGDIHLKLYWMQLTANPADLGRLEQDQRWSSGKTNLHPAMLMVYIDNVSDLPYPKHNREPSPYIEVTLGNETKKTFPKPSTVNPIYQQKFLYFVSDADNQVLHVEAKDDSSGRSLGEVTIGLKGLLKEEKMELYQQTWSLALQAHQAPIVMTLRLRALANIADPDAIVKEVKEVPVFPLVPEVDTGMTTEAEVVALEKDDGLKKDE